MKIAILGCGSIGRRHIQNLLSLDRHELIAFDPSLEARKEVGQQFNLPIYRTLDEIWKETPEVVFVTSPSNSHIQLAVEAAQHNCHIFIEKPLSHSLEGVSELAREVVRRDLITMVGCNMRFHPGPKQVKSLIVNQVIGQPIAARIQAGSYLPGWRPQQDYRESYSASDDWGGAILDCIHEIDLALWYLGDAKLMASVNIPAESIDLQTDGLAELLLLHESNVISNIHLNFVQRDYRRCCQIIGTEGTIYWDFMEHEVKVYGKNGDLERTFPGPEKWSINQMYIDEVEYFLGCLKTKSRTFNSLADGKRTLKLALEARTSKVS